MKTGFHYWRLVIVLAAGLFAAGTLWAAAPFDEARFAAAQQAGKPILLQVHADWCTTCRAQEPVIEALLKEPAYAEFVVFRVDFDRQKDVLKRLLVPFQSTLVVFKGDTEVSRSTAQVSREVIAGELAKAL